MATNNLHKLVFAPSSEQLEEVLRAEARTGWRPSKFEAEPVKQGVLVVLEKRVAERLRRRA